MKRLVRNTALYLLCLVLVMSSMVFSTSALKEGDFEFEYTYHNSQEQIMITGYTGTGSSVNIPSNIKGLPVGLIDRLAFYDLDFITSVRVPDTVNYIGDSAFANCDKLYNIELPATLKDIYSTSFDNTAYYNANSSWVDETLYISKYLIKYRGEEPVDYTVKEGTRGIAYFAFKDTDVTSVTIPESVKFFGNAVFIGCDKLKTVNIPESVTAIPENCFKGCVSLEKIDFHKGVTRIGLTAFDDCDSLKNVYIPESITYLCDDSFYRCDSLKSINIDPASTYAKSVDGVFFRDTALACYPSGKSDTVYNVPEGTTILRTKSFNYVKNLAEINIPASVESIDRYTFYRAYALKEINVDEKNENFKSINGVLYSEGGAHLLTYPNAKENKIYVTPAGVNSVNFYALRYNDYLEVITLSEGVTDGGSIRHMDNLRIVNLPSTLEKLNRESFCDCDKLEVINFAGTEEQWTKILADAGLKVNVTVNFLSKPVEETITAPVEITTVPAVETTIATEPSESTTAEVTTTATDPAESTTTVTDPAESTTAEVTTTVTDPAESTTAEVTTIVTDPAESTTAEVTTTVTDPAESTSAEVTTMVTSQPEESASAPVTTTVETVETTTANVTETATAPKDEAIKGDVNMDGKLNIRDATLVQKHLAKLAELKENQLELADFDLNGKINIKDATAIQKKIANII